MNKNQKGFSVIEIILVLAVASIIGLVGWLASHKRQNVAPQDNSNTTLTANTSSWKTYSNSCLNLSFKSPKDIKVSSPLPKQDGTCSYLPASESSTNVNYWAVSVISIGMPAIESVQSGPYVEFDLPLPINNLAAMKFEGLNTASSVTELFDNYIADKSNNASLSRIGGHKAAVSLEINPNQQPKDYRTVDQPYCPCTTKTLLLDTGRGSVIPITAHWLNSDKNSAAISNSIIDSIKFNN